MRFVGEAFATFSAAEIAEGGVDLPFRCEVVAHNGGAMLFLFEEGAWACEQACLAAAGAFMDQLVRENRASDYDAANTAIYEMKLALAGCSAGARQAADAPPPGASPPPSDAPPPPPPESPAKRRRARSSARAAKPARALDDRPEVEGVAPIETARGTQGQAIQSQGGGCSAPTCACRGNCGSKLCKSAQMRLYRAKGSCATDAPFCLNLTLPGFDRCAECKCLEESCAKGRSAAAHGLVFWCNEHGKARAKVFRRAANGSDAYLTPSGAQSALPEWTPELRFVARCSVLLRGRWPDDTVAGVELLHSLDDAGSAKELSAGFSARNACLAFLGSTIKWPAAVRYWAHLCGTRQLSGAREITDAYLDVLLFCDGKTWPQMFTRMVAGRSEAISGLSVSAQQFGLLRPASEGDEPGAVTLRLGRSGKEYVLSGRGECLEDLVGQLLRGWPAVRRCVARPADGIPAKLAGFSAALAGSSAAEIADSPTAFMGHIKEYARLARGIRSTATGAGLQGGRDEGRSYLVKGFCRWAALYLERKLGFVFDHLPMRALSEWCPDASGHLEVFAETRAGDLRARFGDSPLMLSAWLCLTSMALKRFKLKEPPEVDLARVRAQLGKLAVDEAALVQDSPLSFERLFHAGPDAIVKFAAGASE